MSLQLKAELGQQHLLGSCSHCNKYQSAEESNRKLSIPVLFFTTLLASLCNYLLLLFVASLFLASSDMIAALREGRAWFGLPWTKSSDLVQCPPWELGG